MEKRVLFLDNFLKLIRVHVFRQKLLVFNNSSQYWRDRYCLGGNSRSGSYGRLAKFKALVLNDFIKKNGISTIVEFGCGDGAQLSLLNCPAYIGFDVAEKAIEICKQKFDEEKSFKFFLLDDDEFNLLEKQELALSLDVIYHLIEEEVFESYMKKLFDSASRFVIIYAYSFDKTYNSKHEMGRDFLSWVGKNIEGWELFQKLENQYPYDKNSPDNTSQSDFYFFRVV